MQIYPSVGLQHSGDSIRTNFGQSPFKFDIEYHVQQQQNDVWNKIWGAPLHRKILQGFSKVGGGSIASVSEENDLSPLTEEESRQVLNELIMSYLVHHGHVKTAQAFEKQCRYNPVKLDGMDDIDLPSSFQRTSLPEADIELRTNIVKLVDDGNIDEAVDLLRDHYPSVLKADQQLVSFKLRLRKFVELILGTTELKKKMKASKEREQQHWKADPPQDSWMADEMGMDIDEDVPSTMSEPTLSSNSTSSQYGHDKYMNPQLKEINAQYEDALNTAILHGQTLWRDFYSDPKPELEALFHKTFGIVAWEDPSAADSDSADIVGQQSRTALAHEVNDAILSEKFIF